MRLLESEQYRGRQIRVYVIYPGEPEAQPEQELPVLGVHIDGVALENEQLSGVYQLADALTWAKRTIDDAPEQRPLHLPDSPHASTAPPH